MLCWSSDGTYLASAGGEWITVWNSADGKPLTVMRTPSAATLLDLRWGDRLTLTFDDGSTATWDIPLKVQRSDLDVAARRRLTENDRQRYGLPPAAASDSPALPSERPKR